MLTYNEPPSRPEDLARILVDDLVRRRGDDKPLPLDRQTLLREKVARLLQDSKFYKRAWDYLQRTSWKRIMRVLQKWEKEHGVKQ